MNDAISHEDLQIEDEIPEPPDCFQQFLDEAKALARYVSRRGNILGADQGRTAAYQGLKDAITAVVIDDQPGNRKNLAIAYSKVTAFTYADYEVNGRTILDTISETHIGETRSRLAAMLLSIGRPRNRPLLIGVLLGLGVLIFEIVIILSSGAADSNDLASLGKIKTLLVPAV